MKQKKSVRFERQRRFLVGGVYHLFVCQVDPSRLPSDADLKTCQETLMLFVEKAWAKIVSSYTNFPTYELDEVLW